MSNYAFTIKCIQKGVLATEAQLVGTMYSMALFHKGHVTEYYFEKDSIDRSHVHGIMVARKGLLLTRYKKPFWHIHLDCLKTETDVSNWRSYIKKEDINFMQFLMDIRKGDLNPFQEIDQNIDLDK